MTYPELSNQVIALAEADLALRAQLLKKGEMNEGYHPEMEARHRTNTEELRSIITQIGYPTAEKLGSEGSEAAWLIIQHSIGNPPFMRHCADLLEQAVSSGTGNALHLAYLSDRIAVFEGRAQRFGTSFDWDQEGRLSPKRLDNLSLVNQRRKQLGLDSVEERTRLIREQAAAEGQLPPADLAHREQQYNQWRKEVGWID